MGRGCRDGDDMGGGGRSSLLREFIIALVGWKHDEAPRSRAYLRVAPTGYGTQLKGDTGRRKG